MISWRSFPVGILVDIRTDAARRISVIARGTEQALNTLHSDVNSYIKSVWAKRTQSQAAGIQQDTRRHRRADQSAKFILIQLHDQATRPGEE